GKLDLAAVVMQDDAEFLHTIISQYGLDIVSPRDLRGLVERYPWLSLGRISAGRYDLVRPIPAMDKEVARLGTLLVASRCAQRACLGEQTSRASPEATLRARRFPP